MLLLKEMINLGSVKMIQIDKYSQKGNVQSEVEALFAVIIPILNGILYSLNRSTVNQVGGYEKITLSLLARLYREGDGDCGICFEYAVHDAIINNNPVILERIDTALTKFCKIKNGEPTSILFGVEKSGAVQLVDSVADHLTDDSYLLTGNVGQPIKLKKHIQGVINAFRKPSEREKLPSSINGLWKADLFVGKAEPDRWIGTTVKINPNQLESARGLRLAVIPCKQGKNDKVYNNETKNLIVCPLPYDQSFMEVFYRGWGIVKQFLNADAHLPKEVLLPYCDDRYVCKELEIRRDFPVLDVIEALNVLKQPNLFIKENKIADIKNENNFESKIDTIVSPLSIIT